MVKTAQKNYPNVWSSGWRAGGSFDTEHIVPRCHSCSSFCLRGSKYDEAFTFPPVIGWYARASSILSTKDSSVFVSVSLHNNDMILVFWGLQSLFEQFQVEIFWQNHFQNLAIWTLYSMCTTKCYGVFALLYLPHVNSALLGLNGNSCPAWTVDLPKVMWSVHHDALEVERGVPGVVGRSVHSLEISFWARLDVFVVDCYKQVSIWPHVLMDSTWGYLMSIRLPYQCSNQEHGGSHVAQHPQQCSQEIPGWQVALLLAWLFLCWSSTWGLQ